MFNIASLSRLVFEKILGAVASDLPGGPPGIDSKSLGLVTREVTVVGVVEVRLDLFCEEVELDSEGGPDLRLFECRDTVLLVVLKLSYVVLEA